MAVPVSSASATTSSASSRLDLALLILRVVLGLIFVVHGGQKLFFIHISGVIGFFGKVGIPLPMIAGPVVTAVEFLGGLALVAGLFTRLAALLIACDMLGAILFVHLKNGFFMPGGFEYPLTIIVTMVGLVLLGAGAYSVDGAMARKRAG
jgi:putative oxidoreductase